MFQHRRVGYLRNVVNRREDKQVELRDYFRILTKNWWIVVAGALLGLFVGLGISALMTPRYASTTTLFVSVRTGEEGAGDLFQGATFAETAVLSYVDIATTAIVLEQVAEELDGAFTRQELDDNLTVTSPSGSVLIDITGHHTDPETAALLANTVAEVLTDVVEHDIQVTDEDQSSPVRVRTIDPGLVPEAPESPRTLLNTALGLMVGLGAGIGAAVLRGQLDTRVHTVSDLEEVTNVPVVGRIAHDERITQRPLVVHDDPRSPRAEAFRTLRTNLQFIAHQDDRRIFVVSSPTPGEGKTHVVANLAVVLAESGARVALVEADLRRPRLAKVMGIEGAVGLSDVLISRATLSDVLQPWGADNLTVLPAGQIPPNPSELLGSPQLRELLNELAEMTDYVLVDAPPVLPVTDAAILSGYASGTLLVSSIGQTKRPDFVQAIESLEKVDGQVLGLIVNRVPVRSSDAAGFMPYRYAEIDDTTRGGKPA